MKVEVNEKKEVHETPFPKLMITKKGTLVLFYDKNVGTCMVSIDSNSEVGRFDTDWDMSSFKDFNGSITLSNKK